MVINMLYGTVKTVDEAGRIVLPKEYRNKMNISVGTKVVLYENDGKLTIEVVTPKCKLCGTAENVNEELSLCEECIKKVKEY
jgi:AbrB family looped-hinge helix DNA binding protein